MLCLEGSLDFCRGPEGTSQGASERRGPFQTKHGNRPSCRDQERRKASDEVVPGTSVSPLVRLVCRGTFGVAFKKTLGLSCLIFRTYTFNEIPRISVQSL